MQPNVLAEPTGIVIADRLGVPEGFQKWIAVQDALHDSTRGVGSLHTGQVTETNLDRLGLTRPRFTTHENRLVVPFHRQSPIRQGRCFVNVRFQNMLLLLLLPQHEMPHIVLPLVVRVQIVHPLVRIDGDANVSGPCVGLGLPVSVLQIVQNGCLVQKGEVDHVGTGIQLALGGDILEWESVVGVVGECNGAGGLVVESDYDVVGVGRFDDAGGEPGLSIVADVDVVGGGGSGCVCHTLVL